jgi:iron complex outermembrane receptor protein
LRASWLGAVDVTDTAATGSTSDTSNTRAPLSSRLGARIGDDELAVLANLGRAVRLPTLGELYGQSAVLGGNAALLPERAWGLDLGLRGKLAPTGTRALFEAQAFVFGRKTDDLVVYQRDSFLVFRPRNVRASRTLGAEGSFAVSAFRVVRAEQGVTLLDARDTSGGPGIFEGQLPFLPRLVSSTRLTITPWAPNPRTEAAVSGTLVRQGARFADRSGLVVIPAQTTLDLEARLRWPCGARLDATLRARADNVTSARRVDVIGYPLPPRQLFLSLELAAGGGS